MATKKEIKEARQKKLAHPRFEDQNADIGYSRVWFNLLRVQRYFLPRVSRILREENIKDLVWYEILMHVEKAGLNGHPMGDLETKLFLPQYALSRHVSRMEEAGLLTRSSHTDERGRQILFITGLASGLHDRVWPKYFEAIKDEFSDRLTQDEAYELTRLLMRLTY